MTTALLFSSVAAGLIATAVMIVFLYLPLLWGGAYYDTLGAIGAIYLQRTSDRARLLGALTLFAGGILFALFYGAFVLMFVFGPFPPPDYTITLGPADVNLFFPLLGLIGGFGQGIFVSLLSSFLITDHHPLPEYRDTFNLILSFMVGHTVYGVVVMFFQSQFLGFFVG